MLLRRNWTRRRTRSWRPQPRRWCPDGPWSTHPARQAPNQRRPVPRHAGVVRLADRRDHLGGQPPGVRAGGGTDRTGTATIKVPAHGSGTLAFSGTGRADIRYVASGVGTLTFVGSGSAKIKIPVSGYGVLAFTGLGSSTVKILVAGAGAIMFSGVGVAVTSLPTDIQTQPTITLGSTTQPVGVGRNPIIAVGVSQQGVSLGRRG